MRTKLRGKVTLLFMTFALLLAIPAWALADEVANNVDDTIENNREEVNLDSHGKSTTVEIYVNATTGSGDSDPACNFDTASEKLKLRVFEQADPNNALSSVVWDETGATTTNASTPNDTIEFTGCGLANSKTVKVTSANVSPAVGTTFDANIDFEIPSGGNTAGGSFNTQTGRFTVKVAKDVTAPDTTITAGPEAGSTVNSNSATFEFTSTEANSTFETRLDNGAWESNGTATSKTYNSLSDATHTFYVRATDAAGNTDASPASRSWTVQTDSTAPTSTHSLSSLANGNGWHNQNVTVTLNAEDNEDGSGVKEIRYSINGGADALYNSASKPVISTEGITTFNFYAVDVAGNVEDRTAAEQSFQIKLDKTAPSVAYKSASPAANAAGWNNTNVTATFEATDQLSGMGATDAAKTATGEAIASTEGLNITVDSPAFTDRAGNTAAAGTATSAPFDIDKTAPTIEGSRLPLANANGWNNTNVTVSFDCDDELSGLDSSGCPVDVTLSGEGANQSVERSVTDAAGNTASDTVSDINIDKTPPVVTLGAVSGTANANGWYKSAVSQTFNASDALSGFPASFTTPFSVPSSGEGNAVEVKSGAVTDKAGNTNNGISAFFKIDLSDPHSIVFNGGPAAGESYDFGNVPTAPTCSAQDNVSGMPANGGCVVTGHSNAVGNHTMTATATDNAGRTATATRSYTVKGYTLSGFYQPIDMNETVNTVKNGSTVPVKFELFQSVSGTELTSTSAVTSILARPISCTVLNGEPEDPIETLATGSTSLRYDTTAGQFIYNWATPKGASQVGKCYSLTMTAADNSTINNSTITAYFKLK